MTSAQKAVADYPALDSDASYRTRLAREVENLLANPYSPERDLAAIQGRYSDLAALGQWFKEQFGNLRTRTKLPELCVKDLPVELITQTREGGVATREEAPNLVAGKPPLGAGSQVALLENEKRLETFLGEIQALVTKTEAQALRENSLQELLAQYDELPTFKEKLLRACASEQSDRLAADVHSLVQGTATHRELQDRLRTSLTETSKFTDKLNDLIAFYSLANKLKRHPDLQSRLAFVTQYTTSKWLLEQELKARIDPGNPTKRLIPPDDNETDAYEVAKRIRARGLCFSGGGIRSATFNLGVLQGLARLRKLPDLDYISSVSGGGYIHQFLACWVREQGLAAVQTKLNPIPAPGTGQISPPEAIRWLRRYSNYLSPSLGLFGADLWTIFTVWGRNTLLNLVMLLATFMFVLLLPHGAVTHWAVHLPLLPSTRGQVPITIVGCGLALAAALLLWYSFPAFDDRSGAGASSSFRVQRSRRGHAHAIMSMWLILALLVSPVAYKLAVPGGSQFSPAANDAYEPLPRPVLPTGIAVVQTQGPVSSARWTVCKDDEAECKVSTNAGKVRLDSAWSRYKPRCAVPALFSFLALPCQTIHDAYVQQNVISAGATRGQESPLVWLYDVFPLFSVLLCFATWYRLKEDTLPLRRWLSVLAPLTGIPFCIGLLLGLEYLFFVMTFLVDQKLIMSLGVAVLPPLLLTVPFIALELCTGLMGTLFGSAQREWIARLRALSLQYSFLWIALVGVALLGRFITGLIAHQAIVKYSVWSAWVISTATGILLGRSRKTSGQPSDDPDNPGKSAFSPAELAVKIAPPVFIVGLLLLLSTFASWIIEGPNNRLVEELTIRWAVVLAAMAALAALFSWRIDINEFSMNAFYRDRLARCYAGASNPARKPNMFTGFDVTDGSPRVAELLPKTWRCIDTKKPGEYEGPFPIFCTALNLTTGRDLAYQERKAASFAFTPLYSGYSTGWTDTTNCRQQYNGFVPTVAHIKFPKGITIASAVAISGAAASPNMGFHTSAPLAFLMTIFNVRLGWWLRNPRRPDAPDSPRNALGKLASELFGATDDTNRYVYLSDGGHFENMGLYELLRRRCRTVIVCDAEEDHTLVFEGFGQAIRKARLDFGVEIRILEALGNAAGSPAPAAPEPGTTNPTGAEGLLEFKHFPGNLYHAVRAEIRYPEDGPDDAPGKLLYLKSSLTGDEPADVINYHRVHPSFPFDTTADQFFTESQFESYRRLGEHILSKHEISTWISANL